MLIHNAMLLLSVSKYDSLIGMCHLNFHQVTNANLSSSVILHMSICYYSKHCNTAQEWSWCTQYVSSVHNRYPVVHLILCVGEKNGRVL